MAALFNKKPEPQTKPGLPSQKELFLRSLYPGNHVDLVLNRDESVDVVEVRGSVIHDITRERQLILAQTLPPILPSQAGLPLEVTFLCQVQDSDGRSKLLRTTYNTELAAVIPNYRISPTQSESALVVPLPSRLEIASLRLYYRVEPQVTFNMRAYWSIETLGNEIDELITAFGRTLRKEIWLREKHARRLAQELILPLQNLIETAYGKTDSMQQAYVKDISEGGAKLVHDRNIKLDPYEIQKLTLMWQEDLWEVLAKVVRSGELEPPHPSRIFTAVRFVNMNAPIQVRMSRLMQEMMRKELANRAANNL
ncbi:MAG: hypothetical protein LBJ14_02250 [Desulfarculales bacterium]|nr:hypothetical protein [Desulfarculales bacterium]